MHGLKVKVNTLLLQSMLAQLPDRIQRRVLRGAAGPASTPMLRAAKRLCPKGDSGLLRKSLIRKIKTWTHGNTVAVIIGPNVAVKGVVHEKFYRPTKYAHLVEGGTKPHNITIKYKNGREFTLQHPGTRATHFLKRAQESSASNSTSIARSEMYNRIVKEARKLSRL